MTDLLIMLFLVPLSMFVSLFLKKTSVAHVLLA